MTTQNPCTIAPVVSIVNNSVTALSTDIAKFFGKRHDNVVRDIENLLSKLPSSRVLNFEETKVEIATNLENIASKLIKAYRMTRDGFTLLVMGWTGERALQFKLAWLDAFNAMEKQLYEKNVQQTTGQDISLITPEQQYEISSHVMRKTHALFGNRNYSAVYRALKRRFRIPRYTCLLNRDYETALKFIDSLTKGDFNLPDVPEKSKPSTHGFIKVPVNPVSRYRYAINSSSFTFNVSRLTTTEKDLTVVSDVSFLPERKIEISAGELRAIKVLVYFFEDLFKPFIQWAEQEARRQHHPRASAFYDVWNEPDLFMCALKRIIKRNS